MKPASNS